MPRPLIRHTRVLRRAWNSPALRAAVALTLSGGAFALGNLLLARVLPKEEYGRFSLGLAIVMIGIVTGPLGAQIIVNRHRTDPGRRLLARTLSTSGLVGLVLTIGAGALYPLDLPLPLLAAMLAAIIGGACNLVVVGHYQSRQRYGLALLVSASTNLSLLATGIAAAVLRPTIAFAPAALFATFVWTRPVFAWWRLFRDRAALEYPNPPYPWGEALVVVGTIGAGMLLSATERLVIPRALSLPDLATFSVLATLVGSPFQMLNQGVGFTLLPSLRGTQDRTARRRVLRQELLTVAGACALSGVTVWWLTPIVLRHFLVGRYVLPAHLILAAIAVGSLRPLGAVAIAVVNAVGSARELVALGGIGWTAWLLGFWGAWAGVRWGLTGLVYGVGLGWLLRAAAAGWLASRSMQRAEGANQVDGSLVTLVAEE
jgi:O-antigen/teichoic acid export membrane protein